MLGSHEISPARPLFAAKLGTAWSQVQYRLAEGAIGLAYRGLFAGTRAPLAPRKAASAADVSSLRQASATR
jgi:hypothetical protein